MSIKASIKIVLDNEHKLNIGKKDSNLQDKIHSYCEKNGKLYKLLVDNKQAIKQIYIYETEQLRELDIPDFEIEVDDNKVISVKTVETDLKTVEINGKQYGINELRNNYSNRVKRFTRCKLFNNNKVYIDEKIEDCFTAVRNKCSEYCINFGLMLYELTLNEYQLYIEYHKSYKDDYGIVCIERTKNYYRKDKVKMAKTQVNLKWRNKLSGETGYVKSVSPKNGCFYNTFNKDEAKKYSSDNAVAKDIELLKNLGEAETNEFFVE